MLDVHRQQQGCAMRSSSTFRFVFQLGLLTVIGNPYFSTLAAGDRVAIYRCHLNGVLTFSDRPCDTASETHEIDTDRINTSAAPAEAKASEKSASTAKRRKSGSTKAPDPAKAAAACNRLNQSLRDTRSKMRSGYKASEGERLKERQAKLKNQLRLARCS
jgi:Domain of unknown function (DUF4124)